MRKSQLCNAQTAGVSQAPRRKTSPVQQPHWLCRDLFLSGRTSRVQQPYLHRVDLAFNLFIFGQSPLQALFGVELWVSTLIYVSGNRRHFSQRSWQLPCLSFLRKRRKKFAAYNFTGPGPDDMVQEPGEQQPPLVQGQRMPCSFCKHGQLVQGRSPRHHRHAAAFSFSPQPVRAGAPDGRDQSLGQGDTGQPRAAQQDATSTPDPPTPWEPLVQELWRGGGGSCKQGSRALPT